MGRDDYDPLSDNTLDKTRLAIPFLFVNEWVNHYVGEDKVVLINLLIAWDFNIYNPWVLSFKNSFH
jgi:hypothetical protein